MLGLRWRLPLLEASVISIFVLSLFTYWFGIADRYAVFLYGHTAVGMPNTEPFDEATSSRYWMAGLVAAGAVMILYSLVYWLLGQFGRLYDKRFVPSVWWRVWLLCAGPIAIGVPVITMTMNSPTLPARLAAACVVATLLGLAVALLPGKWAAEQPVALMWLVADGMGLVPALLLVRVIELPGRGLLENYTQAWMIAIGGILAGAAWLAVMSALRFWRHKQIPDAGILLLAGLGLSYLLLPLIHHLFATPPAYRYISTAGNFFAYSWGIQCLAVLSATGLAIGGTQLRRKLQRSR